MTDQHRASPELWAAAEKWGSNTMDMVNCILELRSRVELLEATQHAHVDTSQLAEARQPTFAELLLPRVFTADEVAPIVAPTVNKSLMTDLSPAAQAVLDAYMEASDGCYVDGEWIQDHGGQLAAALRALAVRINGADAIRQDVLDIAAELEDQ